MTAAEIEATATPGLLGKLMAAVRPEFRAGILVPERGALVFDVAPCRVPGCVRQPRTRGLCKGHYNSWVSQGRPDLDGFSQFSVLASCRAMSSRSPRSPPENMPVRSSSQWAHG